MTIVVALNHMTRYRYDRPVRMSPQTIRLRPAPHTRTPVTAYSLRIRPDGHFLNWQQDPHNNWQARVVIDDVTEYFEVEVDLHAELAVFNPFDFFVEEWAEQVPFTYPDLLRDGLAPYLTTAPSPADMGDQFAALVEQCRPKVAKPTVNFLVETNQLVAARVGYRVRMEPGVQTPEQTLTLASGSCRDSAWLQAHLLRQLGYATRFCSGYLIQLAPDVQALHGPSGTDVDFADLHAWCEVYVPGAGWIGLDATSGLLCGEGHIPLTATPEPTAAAPITGGVAESQVTLEHRMSVTRIIETPRTTQPVSNRQWSAIDALGHTVDARLASGDVRLTQRDRPTFVAIDDVEAAQWNTATTGPGKQERINDLATRLAGRLDDAQQQTFSVVPDVGVVAVDLPMAAHWTQLTARTIAAYDEARQARLSAEKFRVDGRAVGTGGGSQLTLGGATPDDSAFLRRPELADGLTRFWADHPSLPSLLSGPGPVTPQAGADGDVTFPGLGMPPHPRMHLMQQLLLRALIARLWETPYTTPQTIGAKPWHDRFLLPAFCWQDFTDVIADLNQAGFAFDAQWFAAHFMFRFPVLGTATYRGITMELRHALEPWGVPDPPGEPENGEIPTRRVQLAVRGAAGGRFAAACNGRRLPLTPTGVGDEAVAGVRFPSATSPAAHTPLVFDLVDTWNERALGALTYHVINPAGRLDETTPMTAYEAEARRRARVVAGGHTPGRVQLDAEPVNPAMPTTLDLTGA